MKLYVVLATLLISVACKGAASEAAPIVPSVDNFFTRLCSNDERRKKLYMCDPCKSFSFYKDEDLTDNSSRKTIHTMFYHANPEPSYTLDDRGWNRERLCYQSENLKDGHIYSVSVVVTRPDGTRVRTTWQDKWIDKWYSPFTSIEPQGKTTTVFAPQVAASAAQPPVHPVQPAVPQTSSIKNKVLAGAVLAAAVFVYRYREPIKKAVAKLMQGAKKV